MLSDWFDKVSSKSFEIAAFSILGLLLVARPTTLVPTLIMLMAAIAVLGHSEFRRRFFDVLTSSQYKWMSYAMLVWFGVALLLALIHQSQEKFYFPDNALRMVMAITLLAMVTKPSSKNWLLSGIVVAGFASAYWALQAWPWSAASRPQGTTNNAIHFGNLSAVIMMLSLTAALFANSISSKFRTLLFIAALGGCVGAVSSLSRSSWVVLICLLPLFFITSNARSVNWLKKGIAVSVVAVCVAVLMSTAMRDRLRVTEALVDVQQIQEGNYMSSVGARVAMWQTAWNIFKENPLVGVGPGRFQSEIVRRIEVGEIPNTEIYNQPHSDIMHALSSGGLLKFLSYLGILTAPFVFFYRRYREVGANAENRLMPVMGMQVVGAYFLTGLTNSNFDLQIYSTTYAVLVCVLAKLSVQPEGES
jgi:O-antigen ligase